MRLIILNLFLLFFSGWIYASSPSEKNGPLFDAELNLQPIQTEADKASREVLLKQTAAHYEEALKTKTEPESVIYRQLALTYSQLGEPEKSVEMVRSYLHTQYKPSILQNPNLDPIRNTQEFKNLEESYTPQKSGWSYFYLYISLIGFYIAFILFINRKIDKISRILIGSFVFIHSVFILHICLLITNYQFEYPHFYLSSTAFSFLYGPLLYFYFKRSVQHYELQLRDVLHFLPTLLLLIYLIPVYAMPASEKLGLMLGREGVGSDGDATYLTLIVALKLTSLIVYGGLIRKHILTRSSKNDTEEKSGSWQRNIYRIHVAYILCYTIYGILIINDITSGLLYHAQVLSMALMVIYAGYFASLKPELFGGVFSFENRLFPKYQKSGLTDGLSVELRDRLIHLFQEEEIYRENDLSLGALAEKLETTRHNASQVINEHFNLSFHELVNRYRIEATKRYLHSDLQRNLNIIDIAYEVGFNNKVTFNKAFKKETGQTPSEYQKNYLFYKVKQA